MPGGNHKSPDISYRLLQCLETYCTGSEPCESWCPYESGLAWAAVGCFCDGAGTVGEGAGGYETMHYRLEKLLLQRLVLGIPGVRRLRCYLDIPSVALPLHRTTLEIQVSSDLPTGSVRG